ncbi:MAG: hypothetical protein JSV39_04475 [Candidatus Aenigmatarchaeota archaeon]|nr:MAG: hypothetical protein JSV39_04475 [Candidatus Aenigmarchaeota archaeon]
MEVHRTTRGVDLYEISDDIFSLALPVNTGIEGGTALGVHAYSKFNSYKDYANLDDFRSQQVNGVRKGYLEDVDTFITNYPGPLILCEPKSRLYSTVDHLVKNLKRKGNTFFIQTNEELHTAKAQPVNIEPRDVAEFIAQLPGRPIYLFGGGKHEGTNYALREGWDKKFTIDHGNFLTWGLKGNVGCLTQWAYWLKAPNIGNLPIEILENLTYPVPAEKEGTFLGITSYD